MSNGPPICQDCGATWWVDPVKAATVRRTDAAYAERGSVAVWFEMLDEPSSFVCAQNIADKVVAMYNALRRIEAMTDGHPIDADRRDRIHHLARTALKGRVNP